MALLRNQYPYQDVDPSEARNSDQACNRVTGTIKIGTCGFGVAQAEYARTFYCVEIKYTFYEPPRLTTIEPVARANAGGL